MKHTVKKWIISGTLKTFSPLVIGTGDKSEDTDIILQKDENANPFIPATSIAGSLRHSLFEEHELNNDPEALRKIWGDTFRINGKDKTIKSAVTIRDAKIEPDYTIELRDGIRIDQKTGLVEKGAKYDYEALTRGAKFKLKITILQSDQDEERLIKKLVNTIKTLLESEEFVIGGMNTKGYGKVKLQKAKVTLYDFTQAADVINWLEGKEKTDPFTNLSEEELYPRKTENDLTITANLKLKTSLLIRSYSADPNAPDTSYMTSDGKAVLAGSSVKGALRQRGEKIINTLTQNEEKTREMIKHLFGYVETENGEGEKIKSRFYTKETYKNINHEIDRIQARIKIDRFTGGTIKTALFDEMPLWPEDSDDLFTVSYTIKDCKEWEVGLALLILKDLMTADLPIGGGKTIGRGLFIGHTAEINYKNKKYQIRQTNPIEMEPEKKEQLEQYVKAFNKAIREGEAIHA
ncbi:MAG: RAMP superfamily CRISPR-associated protein [Thermotogota bacterium]|nr:RAMP superfamily CRISPR-associated protein [Thermotogota bacterium]